jgi:hypothetical protein
LTKFFNVILLALFTLTANAQSPNWAWAKGVAGGTGFNTATDALGNVYVTSNYVGSFIVFGSDTIINPGGISGYLIKYDAWGNFQWARNVYGSSYFNGKGLAIDTSGNIFVIGGFYLPSITIGAYTLTNSDSIGNTSDMFIIKFDSSGNILWVKSEGGNGSDKIGSIATDIEGNFYITGYYASPSILLGSTTLTNVNSLPHFFIAKYDTFGNVVWVRGATSMSADEGLSVATDPLGGVYVSGAFSNTIIFGSNVLNGGNYAMFILKYDDSGNVIWTKTFGGNNAESCSTLNYQTNVLILSGVFNSDTLIFDADTLINSGFSDGFLVKCDNIGNVIWAKSVSGPNTEASSCNSIDIYGNVYFTGYFNSPSISIGGINLFNSGSDNQIFIAKYDSTGLILWAEALGDLGYDICFSSSNDSFGNVYVTGRFDNTITFGSTNLINPGTNNFYIAKLGATPVGFEQKIISNDQSIYPNPSNGIFTFNESKNVKTVEVFNMMGELILSQGNVKQINLSDFAKGIYVARINGAFVTRLVKE